MWMMWCLGLVMRRGRLHCTRKPSVFGEGRFHLRKFRTGDCGLQARIEELDNSREHPSYDGDTYTKTVLGGSATFPSELRVLRESGGEWMTII